MEVLSGSSLFELQKLFQDVRSTVREKSTLEMGAFIIYNVIVCLSSYNLQLLKQVVTILKSNHHRLLTPLQRKIKLEICNGRMGHIIERRHKMYLNNQIVKTLIV